MRLLVVVLAACAGSSPAPICPTSATPTEATREPVAVAPNPRGQLCWAKGRPAVVAAAPVDKDPFCNAFDITEHAKVEARVRKEFVIHEKPSKLVVDFGCDVAGDNVRDVVFEDGSGHGGSLRIVRFRREADRVDVRMIGSSHYHGKQLGIRTARVDLAAFDALIASARVALMARPHLVRLTDPKAGIGFGGASGSSNDFHLRLTIIDAEGKETDRHFTGYESSSEQEQILPMRFATEPIEKLLAATTFKDEPITDEDRQIFRAGLARMTAGNPFWWVKERYVALAPQLGTIEVVPDLVRLLNAKVGDRVRPTALDAIIALTGWNARLDARGATRSLDEAIASVREGCVL